MKLAVVFLPLFALGIAQAQDMPDGKGKDLIMQICTDCHGADVITAQHNTKDGWASIVDSMVSRGASGTKEQLDTIVDYLTKNFGPQKDDAAKKQ
ncbi:MAG TPA: cytochrome c [Bryobacteraceae bacterium]|nr:cytochrome c [Bryobacteraceae bacterium]